ncbi:hypothetical protein A4G99_05520 [Haladaptatus sp. R4]|uniref:DUF7523 family protein n=1 Tax=Haladaptatus sp. R4 TaxID=1679489 RepID=UPI0007B4C500|nr:hypothetical protein [Haladaptatus sp. R4]KZN25871.1 hypothetical protein A4G99_05520 [Haladaptatus sp. R4]
MSLAEATRTAARRRPFLLAALRADVVNYTAAAGFLAAEVGADDTDAVSTALSRFADELPTYETESRDVRVTMRSGLDPTDEDDEEAVLSVGGTGFAPNSGSLTGIVVTGNVDAPSLASVLSRLLTEDVEVVAAAVAESLVVVVERRDGANAVRFVEDALDAVPK